MKYARAAYTRRHRKSIRRASVQLQTPRSAVYEILHKSLRHNAYKVQLPQTLKPEDKQRRKQLAMIMMDRLDSDLGLLTLIWFSNESKVPRPWSAKYIQFENMGTGEPLRNPVTRSEHPKSKCVVWNHL